MFSPTKKTTL